MKFLWTADVPGSTARCSSGSTPVYVMWRIHTRTYSQLSRLSAAASTMVLPQRAEGRRTMGEGPRPRANSWQIAGVWISAAALLIAAARAAVDLWLLLRP